MAALPYEDIVSSDPFKFLVGPKLTEFTIHSALVAKQSPVLAKYVHGDMKEARERCVSWEDADLDTFVRFSQFVYTGDYRGAVYRSQPVESDFPEPSSLEDVYSEGPAHGPLMRKHHSSTPDIILERTRQECMWLSFQSLHRPPTPNLAVRRNTRRDDYSEVLISHARMYVFADRYDIGALQSLSLRKLRQVLEHFVLHPERVGDVVQLVQYTYSNTLSTSGRQDALRRLVSMYVACKVEDLWARSIFVDKLGQSIEFLHDLISHMIDRLD